MPLPPFRCAPLLVEKPWGGRRLAEFGRDLPDDTWIGESWDLADLDPSSTSVEDPVTRVSGGPLDGWSLSGLIAEHGGDLLGDAAAGPGHRFPLLVKLLDAREHLSVQVHPPAAYVREHPEAHLKTESWYVMDADEGAELMIGVRDGVTMDDLRGAAGSNRLPELLRRVPAHVGELHHLPAGTVHALGAGVMVAEIQTPSDTTYRLYDWTEEYGRAPRDLDLEAALACASLEHREPVPAPGGSLSSRTIVETPHYTLRDHVLPAGAPLRLQPGLLRVLMVLRGEVTIDGLEGPVRTGGTAVVPASAGCSVEPGEDTTLFEAVPA